MLFRSMKDKTMLNTELQGVETDNNEVGAHINQRQNNAEHRTIGVETDNNEVGAHTNQRQTNAEHRTIGRGNG